MAQFTPLSGLGGGAMIGLAAANLLIFNGDIMGASGIISSLALDPLKSFRDPSQFWKAVFITSFLIMTWLLSSTFDLAQVRELSRPTSLLGYGLAGLTVGFGTKLGNGCTSGHGICGLARLSRRSFAAVMTFMATAILTAYVTEPTAPWAAHTEFLRTSSAEGNGGSGKAMTEAAMILIAAFVLFTLSMPFFVLKNSTTDEWKKNGSAIVSGLLFAAGLSVSGMVYPYKVHGFLNITGIKDGSWDPTLAMVMLGGVVVSFLSYQLVEGYSCIISTKSCTLQSPLALSRDCQFNIPKNQVIDHQLILGAIMFGIGWGIAGVCPGPAFFQAGVGVPEMLQSWWPAYFVGAYLAKLFKGH